MVPIAWRNLFADRLRLAISVGGVALSIMLVLLLNGFLTGMNQQITAYIDNTPADYYVSQKGVANLQGAGSIISRSNLQKVESVEGVRAAMPVFTQYVILDIHGKKVTTFLVGYEPARGGGPWSITEGRAVNDDDEMVIDRVLARRHGLALGEEMDVLGKRFRIVGLSDGTASWMVGMLFTTHEAATALLRSQGTTSYILVAGNGDSGLGERLKVALGETNVTPRATIAANDLKFLAGVFSTPLRMMVLIAVGIGALLVGLTIYSATVERVREYGVLKAIGMHNGRLYGIVGQQALSAAAFGFGIGLLLVWLVSAGIQQAWPQFLIVVDRTSILQAAAGAVIMALVASLVPARYVANIDPARVFRR
ncbi:MAG: ABC transporter permease [Chloroflexi bacterium]|nr:ABC transporter permease [Chloroflexota bacterium]